MRALAHLGSREVKEDAAALMVLPKVARRHITLRHATRCALRNCSSHITGDLQSKWEQHRRFHCISAVHGLHHDSEALEEESHMSKTCEKEKTTYLRQSGQGVLVGQQG